MKRTCYSCARCNKIRKQHTQQQIELYCIFFDSFLSGPVFDCENFRSKYDRRFPAKELATELL